MTPAEIKARAIVIGREQGWGENKIAVIYQELLAVANQAAVDEREAVAVQADKRAQELLSLGGVHVREAVGIGEFAMMLRRDGDR